MNKKFSTALFPFPRIYFNGHPHPSRDAGFIICTGRRSQLPTLCNSSFCSCGNSIFVRVGGVGFVWYQSERVKVANKQCYRMSKMPLTYHKKGSGLIPFDLFLLSLSVDTQISVFALWGWLAVDCVKANTPPPPLITCQLSIKPQIYSPPARITQHSSGA